MHALKLGLAWLMSAAGCGAGRAAEPWEGVYEGAVGQQRVIVELAGEGARYNYIGRQNDLGLIVSAKGQKHQPYRNHCSKYRRG